MHLNCGAEEDSWESLGLQGEQTSQSLRKSTLNIHWKDWCWSWDCNTLATWCTDAGKDSGQEEKGMTEDEMVAWHHWLNGHDLRKLWEIVKDRGAGCATVHGVEKNYTRFRDWKTTVTYYSIYSYYEILAIFPVLNSVYLWSNFKDFTYLFIFGCAGFSLLWRLLSVWCASF